MRVLLLSSCPERLTSAIIRSGDEWASTVEPLTSETPDWIVSFGYRNIIREPHLSRLRDRMINIHISLLPWNRGADPNFWSWFDRTPKGVSIHRISAGIDTGELLAQREVTFGPDETLRTSYAILIEQATGLFEVSWPAIRAGTIKPIRIEGMGSSHRSRDKEPWWSKLPKGLDTPVAEIERMGLERKTPPALSTV